MSGLLLIHFVKIILRRKEQIMKNKTFPILLAFLCMGFGDASGPLVGLAKSYFGPDNFMAQLLPSVGFIMFGLLSIPIGVLQDRTSKKFILLLGLIVGLI